jgi:hypothetical protein
MRAGAVTHIRIRAPPGVGGPTGDGSPYEQVFSVFWSVRFV